MNMCPDRLQQVCIVGCGRWLRADDQVGLCVVEALMKNPRLSGARIYLTEAPAADIPNWLDGIALLILVDAARGSVANPPGSFQRLVYGRDGHRLHSRNARDTHGLSVDLALNLSESLALLPHESWIYAIAVENCGYGEELSAPVNTAVPKVCNAILNDVQAWLKELEPCHA